MNIRKIPIFKNRPAFLLFTLVVGGTGYYGYSFLNDWRFNNPLIDESIRLI